MGKVTNVLYGCVCVCLCVCVEEVWPWIDGFGYVKISLYSFFLSFRFFIYVLAALGPDCCMVFSSCGDLGATLLWCTGFSFFFVGVHGLWNVVSVFVGMGFAAPRHVGTS